MDIAVKAANDGDEEASVTTQAAAARYGGAITYDTAAGAELVTAVGVGVIVTLNAECTNKLKTGNVFL